MMALTMVCAISCGSACLIREKKVSEGEAWVGTAYLATKKGYSNEATAAIGAVGVIDSALQGAAFGAAFGGAVGVIMGAVIGA